VQEFFKSATIEFGVVFYSC